MLTSRPLSAFRNPTGAAHGPPAHIQGVVGEGEPISLLSDTEPETSSDFWGQDGRARRLPAKGMPSPTCPGPLLDHRELWALAPSHPKAVPNQSAPS